MRVDVQNNMKWIMAAALVTGLMGSVVFAQESSDGMYVLHEYFEGDVGAPNELATGAARDPQVLGAPPSLSMEQNPDELVYGADGPLNDGRLQQPYGDLSPFGSPNPLDDNTDRVDNLNYFAAFEPSVIPYKRVVAQNRVRRSKAGRYEVYLEPGRRRGVRVGGVADGRHETFWGTFMFRAEANRFMPIASVGPEQRVLEVRTEPSVEIEVLVDDAGNFMIRTAHEGLIRVNMKVAVPTFYFSGVFEGVDWSDFTTTAPLDPQAEAVARRVVSAIGLDSSMQSPGEVMSKMVAYFRDFEGKPFPEALNSGDLYESIAVNKIGVCRHRSLAFMVTASALNIETRYVYNEAHAFVEVFWPGRGWRRVDLGGAADQMNATAGENRTVHAAPDNLPQPKRFLDEQERMVQSGWQPAKDGPGRGGQDATSADAAPPSSDVFNDASTDASASPVRDTRAMPKLRLLRGTKLVKRGDAVSLLGRLTTASGRPLAGLDVEVHLGAVGSQVPSSATKLATVQSSDEGWIIEDIAIPKAQAIGRWSMFLYFPGNGEYRAVGAD